jgi:hypothetical protein
MTKIHEKQTEIDSTKTNVKTVFLLLGWGEKVSRGNITVCQFRALFRKKSILTSLYIK